MTPEEADKAYDESPAIPISDEKVKRLVESVTHTAELLHSQMWVEKDIGELRVRKLELARIRDMIVMDRFDGREIGGKRNYYRSRWEANYARYLEWLKGLDEIIDWEHEPGRFGSAVSREVALAIYQTLR